MKQKNKIDKQRQTHVEWLTVKMYMYTLRVIGEIGDERFKAWHQSIYYFAPFSVFVQERFLIQTTSVVNSSAYKIVIE